MQCAGLELVVRVPDYREPVAEVKGHVASLPALDELPSGCFPRIGQRCPVHKGPRRKRAEAVWNIGRSTAWREVRNVAQAPGLTGPEAHRLSHCLGSHRVGSLAMWGTTGMPWRAIGERLGLRRRLRGPERPPWTVLPSVEALSWRTVIVQADGHPMGRRFGQGVLIGTGRVLTALAAVRGAGRILVSPDGRVGAWARVLRVHPATGLAELEVPTASMPPAWLASRPPARGARLVRYVRKPDGGLLEWVFTVARAVRADSWVFELATEGRPMPVGSPLLDRLGRLVGLVVAGVGDRRVAVARACALRPRRMGRPIPSPMLEAVARRGAGDAAGTHGAALRWLAGDPASAAAWVVLGEVLLGLGRPHDARAALWRALALDPEAGRGWRALAFAHLRLREDRRARRAARRAVALLPEDPSAWIALAEVACRLRMLDEALAAADQAARLDPGDADAWEIRARAHLLRGEHEVAFRAFRVALRLDPDHEKAWGGLGMAAAELADAETLLEAIARLEAMGSRLAKALHHCLSPEMRPQAGERGDGRS